MARIIGVPETRINQAMVPALDKVAILAMKNPPALFAALADRMLNPTSGMLDILRRREAVLAELRRRDAPSSTTQQMAIRRTAEIESHVAL